MAETGDTRENNEVGPSSSGDGVPDREDIEVGPSTSGDGVRDREHGSGLQTVPKGNINECN